MDIRESETQYMGYTGVTTLFCVETINNFDPYNVFLAFLNVNIRLLLKPAFFLLFSLFIFGPYLKCG